MTTPDIHAKLPRAENVLLVLAKAPIPGLVKTRLAASVGDDNACALYHGLLADAVERAQIVRRRLRADVVWVHKPRTADFREVVREHCRLGTEDFADSGCLYHGYDDETLAWQQTAELRWAIERGYRKVVIVNTDVPLLDAAVVEQAFRLLDHYDVAVGPATDGGYNLLGITGYWDIISGLDMSAKTVLTQVVDRTTAAGRSIGRLEPLNDIDTLEDLADFIRILDRIENLSCHNTVSAIDRIGLREMSGA